MAAKHVEIHPEALAELKSAIGWYMKRSQPAAVRFSGAVDNALQLIREAPQQWPAGDYATRRFVLQRFPFAIIYREKSGIIQILAVAHGRRRPAYWRGRL